MFPLIESKSAGANSLSFFFFFFLFLLLCLLQCILHANQLRKAPARRRAASLLPGSGENQAAFLYLVRNADGACPTSYRSTPGISLLRSRIPQTQVEM